MTNHGFLKRFRMERYSFLTAETTALDWAGLLALRLRLSVTLRYRYRARTEDVDYWKSNRDGAESDCMHVAKCIMEHPYTCDDEFLATWGTKWDSKTLRSGPVWSLSVGAAYDVGTSVSKLPDDYQRALRRAVAREHSLEDAKLLETPLFIARGKKYVPSHPGSARLLVVDMTATDEEIVLATQRWLHDARKHHRFDCDAGRIPDRDVRRKWVSQRLLQYLDLTLCADAMDVKITPAQMHLKLLSDLEKSADTIRKTTAPNAKKILDTRTLGALVREAERNGEQVPPDSYLSGMPPEKFPQVGFDYIA